MEPSQAKAWEFYCCRLRNQRMLRGASRWRRSAAARAARRVFRDSGQGRARAIDAVSRTFKAASVRASDIDAIFPRPTEASKETNSSGRCCETYLASNWSPSSFAQLSTSQGSALPRLGRCNAWPLYMPYPLSRRSFLGVRLSGNGTSRSGSNEFADLNRAKCTAPDSTARFLL